jgi:hypothetical protein
MHGINELSHVGLRLFYLPVILQVADALAALVHPSHVLMYAQGIHSLAAFLQLELFRVGDE